MFSFQKDNINLEDYFLDNPNSIKDIISKLKIVNVNKASLSLYKANSKEEFIKDFNKLLSFVTFERMQNELISYVKGEECPDNISLARDLEDREFPIEIKWSRIEKSPLIIVSVIDISERITAQQFAKLTNLRFKKLFDNIQMGMAILKITKDEKDFKITNINNFALQDEKLKSSQVINKKISQIFPSVIESNLLSELLSVYKSGKHKEFMAEFTKVVNGKSETFYNKNSILKLSDDEICVIYQNVTKEIRLDIELEKSELKFKTAFNASSQIISIIKMDTEEIVEVNDIFVKASGYNREELIGKKTLDLNLWADSKAREVFFKKLKEKENIDDYEFDFLTKTGEVRNGIMNVRLTQINNENYCLIMVKDITETKERIEKIKILSKAVEHGKISIVITNQKGIIEFVNPYFSEITGYSKEEAIGQNPRFLKSGLQSKDYYKKMWDKIHNGKEWSGEFQNRKKNGEVYWEQATISPVKNAKNEITHFIALKGNITKYKALQEQFYQAQKMEAVGRLAGGIAHDFNNILTIINGYSDILKMKIPEEDKNHQLVNEIKNAGLRASGLTRQLLTFSRKQPLEISVRNLQTVVLNMEKMLNRLIGEDVKLKCELPDTLKNVEIDVGQIEQVIMNLVVNARDAMPNGGEIRINAHNCIYKNKESVCLIVEDSGIGINEEILKNLFEPFFTTKSVGKGTGLGLPVVFSVVAKHKGFIEIKSKVGEGTKFLVYLPTTTKTKNNTPLSKDDFGSSKIDRKHVFLIEDDEIVKKTIQSCLEYYNCEVSTASSVEEAKIIFAQKQNSFDIILSDVGLPDGNGVDLVTYFHSILPKVKIILMSGYTDERTRIELIKKNNFTFLSKPIKLSILIKKITSLQNQSRP